MIPLQGVLSRQLLEVEKLMSLLMQRVSFVEGSGDYGFTGFAIVVVEKKGVVFVASLRSLMATPLSQQHNRNAYCSIMVKVTCLVVRLLGVFPNA